MPAKDRRFALNPDKLAYYERAGWEAYYDRNWPRAFGLLVQLNRQGFGMGWLAALLAAVDTTRATIAFAPLENNDIPAARRFLERFYARARQSLQLSTDAETLAALEMDYWIVHRQLALQRMRPPHEGSIEPMVQSLTRLHAALFHGSAEAMRRSAEFRALAAGTVDRITGRYSDDVAADWQEVERNLQKAYRIVRADHEERSHAAAV